MRSGEVAHGLGVHAAESFEGVDCGIGAVRLERKDPQRARMVLDQLIAGIGRRGRRLGRSALCLFDDPARNERFSAGFPFRDVAQKGLDVPRPQLQGFRVSLTEERCTGTESNDEETTLFHASSKIRASRKPDRMMSTRNDGGAADDGFEAIFRKYYARFWRYYRACRVSDDESHDLAQDAFKRFYERRKQLRGEEPWPFLQSIARSVLLNKLRDQKTAKRSARMV